MISNEEIQRFLKRTDPALTGVVGSLDRQGYPHIVPVWYVSAGNAIHIWSSTERHWVKNLQRDPRASFSVFEEKPPYGAVVMKGLAEIVTGEKTLIDQFRRITRRYIPEADVGSYLEEWSHLQTLVTIVPEKVIGWGRGY